MDHHVKSLNAVEHLRRYGITHFDDAEAYYAWRDQRLGRRAERIQWVLAEEGSETTADLRRFYDSVAHPRVFGAVTSEQADDVAQAALLIEEAVANRRTVLDLGCAIGHISTWLAVNGPADREVVGVDVSYGMVSEARRAAARMGIANVRFSQGDFAKGLPRGPFDAVVDSAALQYASDLPRALQSIRDVITEDGILVTVPQLGRPREVSAYLKSLSDAGLAVQSFGWVGSQDLGRSVARPIIVLSAQAHGTMVDIEQEFELLRRRLLADEIQPLAAWKTTGGPSLGTSFRT